MNSPVATAYEWHRGQSSPLYSFASTGGKVLSEEHRANLLGEIAKCLAWAEEQRLIDEIDDLAKLSEFVSRQEVE